MDIRYLPLTIICVYDYNIWISSLQETKGDSASLRSAGNLKEEMLILVMANLKDHMNLKTTPGSLITNRFSRHPERYMQIFRILRKYKLHHVAAEFGLTHQHEEENDLILLDGHEEEEDHATDLTAALEEL